MSHLIRIDHAALEQARVFFEQCGEQRCEGTALLAGTKPTDDATTAVADQLVIPDQVATPSPFASVRVTDQGDLDIVTALSADQRYFARIHSHPKQAFHSKTDDENPVLTHEGAVSIVVPNFGHGLRDGLDACAVFVRRNRRWIELPPGAVRNEVVVATTKEAS